MSWAGQERISVKGHASRHLAEPCLRAPVVWTLDLNLPSRPSSMALIQSVMSLRLQRRCGGRVFEGGEQHHEEVII
jgi:hypothetical protein